MSLLQNEDFKTEAQLLAAGGAKSQLLNDTKVYISANAINKTLDDAIIDGDIGGGGQGGINYIDNYDFELNATGWGTYQDAAGERPVDATGGTATITLTRTTITPLRGTASGLLSKPASNRQGEGGNYSFTIDTADQGKMQEIRFDYTVTTNYVDGYLRCFIIDVTNGTVIELNQRDILANSGQATYIGYWQAPSNSTSYRLAFHVATNLTTAWDFKFDNVKVGPIQSGNAGTFVSDWQSYTPTTNGLGTLSLSQVQFRRVGDSVEIHGKITTGTTTAVEARVGLPPGLTSSDTSKIPSIRIAGHAISAFSSATYFSTEALIEPSVSYITFGFQTSGANALTKINGTSFGASGVTFTFQATVPIQGWSTGVSASEISSTTAIGFKARLSANQSIGTSALTKITFDTVTGTILGCYNRGAGFSTANTRFEAPESGLYCFNFVLLANTDITVGAAYTAQIRKNGTSIKNFRWWADEATHQWTGTATVELNKGDYVEVYNAGDASYTIIGGDSADASMFEGFKINNPAQITPTEVVAASYETNAGQSIPNATLTTLLFEDRIDDSHNAYNTSTGEYRVPVSGRYLIMAKIIFDNFNGWGITETAQIRIYVNGTEESTTTYELPASSGSNIQVGAPPTFYQANLNTGDIVTIRVNQTSGTSLNVRNFNTFNTFSIVRLK